MPSTQAMSRFATLTTTLSLLIPASAILVANNSPCGTLCGNVLDATTPADITCSESSYMSGNGAVYQQCVSCELSSTYTTGDNETDTESLLYNVRYASAYCLYGVPNNNDIINTPCLTSNACGPFRDSITFKNLSSKVGGYDYCDSWPTNRTDQFAGCTDCLQAGNEYYLSNFITVLQAGCEQRPVPGVTLSLDGSVFSDDIVNITAPTPTATVDPKWFDQGPITIGGKVGIAFGGFAFILFLLGVFIIWNGKRKRRAFLSKLEKKHANSWPGPIDTSPGDMRETPLSQRPLRGWDDSPMSARSEKLFHQHISPFSSHYNSPVSATERLAHWPVMGAHPEYQVPIQAEGGPYGMVPNHQHQMTPATGASSSTMVHSQYLMTPPVHGSPSPAVAPHGSDVSSLSSGNSGKGKGVPEEYEMQPVEGGTHPTMGDRQNIASTYPSQQQQGSYESRPVDQSQFHPGQMFPNMYQQQEAYLQRGLFGLDDDIKK
ncbi:hypothetical protein BGZ63DRAFT_230852 [Mariannaea sp. PMI_226]|nr:hypothetical protein BGZ63DRAFT_230852 [Mariannaea sp. PMI_226]